MVNEAEATLAFSNSTGVGPKGFQGLLRVYGSALNAWDNISFEKYKEAGVGKANFEKFSEFRKKFDVKEYARKLTKAKVEFIPFQAEHYPSPLKLIGSSPIGLYVKGEKALLNEQNLIGVVGARKTTSYGKQVTENLVAELSSQGFVIVSGMALGIDAIAHKTAIDNLGATIAVLGCGVDCPYPRENDKLYEEILDSGGLVISEYPLGMKASAGTFPARNRIISGISKSVLVTEAAEDSGSLITADHAISQGKTVFAVPGPITSQQSRGALKLLKQGAVLVQSVQDILEVLNLKPRQIAKQNIKLLNLSSDEQKVFGSLENEEKTMDELVRDTKISMGKLSIILSEMELKGVVRASGGKYAI